MFEYIFPEYITSALSKLDINRIFEVRIRNGRPIKINYDGRYTRLFSENEVVCAQEDCCNYIVSKACDYSLYSINKQIVQGYITVDKGVRIGLCGEIVSENSGVKTIKNFNSLNVRIPHDVPDCANALFRHVACGTNIYSALIISPPGKGKTTQLRDLSRKLSKVGKNVLIVDERNEICATKNGKAYYDVGDNCDVITFGDKEFAFSYGIRTMAPDIILTDELMTNADVCAVEMASSGGVRVCASVHAGDLEEIKNKSYLSRLIKNKVIDRYIMLSSENIGKIKCVYDANLRIVE